MSGVELESVELQEQERENSQIDDLKKQQQRQNQNVNNARSSQDGLLSCSSSETSHFLEFSESPSSGKFTPTDTASFNFEASTIGVGEKGREEEQGGARSEREKIPVTIELSESLSRTQNNNINELTPSSRRSVSMEGSRDGSMVYAIEILSDISAVTPQSVTRSQSAPDIPQTNSNSDSNSNRTEGELNRTESAPSSLTYYDESSKYLGKISLIEEQYVQILQVAKEYLFTPISKNHHSYKIDPKTGRGIAIFGLASELQVIQHFHSELPFSAAASSSSLLSLSQVIDTMCVHEFYFTYIRYAQEFRMRMEHIQDQAKKNKLFQTLMDSLFPPNLDGIDEDETLFCLFFHPILHISQLQYFYFQIYKNFDPSSSPAVFLQLEKLVSMLFYLKQMLDAELKLLTQDEIQMHERKEMINKMISLEKKLVFGVEPNLLPCISIPLYFSPIPAILIGLSEILFMNQGFKQKGIFRIAPSGDENDKAYDRITEGEDSFDVSTDVFVASNLIKIWFRELPFALFEKIDFTKITDETLPEEAGEMIVKLTEPECSLALWILDLCCVVMNEVEINSMNSKNLAIVFAPNLTPKITNDPMLEMKLTRKCEQFLTHAIEWRAQDTTVKFVLPTRNARNKRVPLSSSAVASSSFASNYFFPSASSAGSLAALAPSASDPVHKEESQTKHSIFSVASFKAHLKGGDANNNNNSSNNINNNSSNANNNGNAFMKRSPSANELAAKKLTLTKSTTGRFMGRGISQPPPPPSTSFSASSSNLTPKQAIALTICASCGGEIGEGESCLSCEGDVSENSISPHPPLSPSAYVDEDGSDKGGKKNNNNNSTTPSASSSISRFGLFKGVGKSSKNTSKSPAQDKKSAPPPPPPPLNTTNVSSNNNNNNTLTSTPRRSSNPPLTPTAGSCLDPLSPSASSVSASVSAAFASSSSPPQRRSSFKSDEMMIPSTPTAGHRNNTSLDFSTGRLRPKDGPGSEAGTVWKKTSIRVETVGINVQALMLQVMSKPKDQARADLQALLAELEAGKQKVQAEILSLDSQL